MNAEVTLIDRGRGMQLSTSRITVMDLVQYFRRGCSPEEIIRWIPVLTPQEIAIVEAYYRKHQAELDEKDREVSVQREQKSKAQSLQFPEVAESQEQRMRRLRLILQSRRETKNGQRTTG